MIGQPLSLLDLPSTCLLAVLQCLAAAADQRSLFSAARAHSRLHQAAVEALSSIRLGAIRQQQQADNVLLYLSKHTQHVSSIDLRSETYCGVTLRQLPPNLHPDRLQLQNCKLQLQRRDGWQGVLGFDGMSALKQLRLDSCVLLDGNFELEAALELLADGLEHLSLRDLELHNHRQHPTAANADEGSSSSDGGASSFDGSVSCEACVLQSMQQLTCLDLSQLVLHALGLLGDDQQAGDALQPLQALTRLVDLRLGLDNDDVISASLLSGMYRLTRLELHGHIVEPAVLDGRTQLQHLVLCACSGLQDGGGWAPQLLSRLQPLQQLTHLNCDHSLSQRRVGAHAPPAGAYSALTASSRLQHLDIRGCSLPVGAWEHMFPTNARQLPQLTSLNMFMVEHPPKSADEFPSPAAFEGSCLVSCCPGLRRLEVGAVQCSTGEIAALQGLTGLHTLVVRGHADPAKSAAQQEVLSEVAQLTGLRALKLAGATEWLLLRLTRLVQLTRLEYFTKRNQAGAMPHLVIHMQLTAEGPDDEPVWRQLLRHHPTQPAPQGPNSGTED